MEKEIAPIARLARIGAALAALLTPCTSLACPSCPAGRAARQQVCEEGLGINLAIALLPFALMFAVSLAFERAGGAR